MTRIVTYNVHRCVGNDRRLDVPRVAEVLAALNPDIVALQELDVGRRRTRQVDQAHEIARRLQMACHFHPAFRVEDELYGDALLTSLPERLVRRGPLPGHDRIRALEPRGAVWIEVTVDGAPLQVINTHLGLVPSEQQRQAAALAGREWLQHPARRDPLILLGDFNATASSVVYRTLTDALEPARALSPERRPSSTFPSQLPVLRIDHVFVSRGVRVRDVFAPSTPQTRLASDHLPLVMDFDLA